jgi:hypothetical protein
VSAVGCKIARRKDKTRGIEEDAGAVDEIAVSRIEIAVVGVIANDVKGAGSMDTAPRGREEEENAVEKIRKGGDAVLGFEVEIDASADTGDVSAVQAGRGEANTDGENVREGMRAWDNVCEAADVTPRSERDTVETCGGDGSAGGCEVEILTTGDANAGVCEPSNGDNKGGVFGADDEAEVSSVVGEVEVKGTTGKNEREIERTGGEAIGEDGAVICDVKVGAIRVEGCTLFA